MLKKKVIALAGAAVLTVSLLAGVTYAWFTNTQIATAGTITAGTLGIDFQATDEDRAPVNLYPQLTAIGTDGYDYPVPEGTIDDVARTSFKLTNASDRQVLVKVSGEDWLKSVTGPSVTDLGGDFSAVKIRYIFGEADAAVAYRGSNSNDAYIFLPEGNSVKEVMVEVWIDGKTGGNEYQDATINFNEMTAKAVQYREAAILDEFGLDAVADADVLAYFVANFGEFE